MVHIPSTYKNFLFDVDFQHLFPEIYLTTLCILFVIYGVVYSTMKSKNFPILSQNLSWLTLLGVFYTFLLVLHNPVNNALLMYNTLLIDDFTKFSKILILLSTFFSISISLQYIRQERVNTFETLVLVLLATTGMIFLVSSLDFITLYLAVELQSLSFYVLAASKRNSEFSTEAGLKYFLLGAFSSGLLLFGCSLVYGFTGVTNFAELAKIFTGGTESILATTSSLPACEVGLVFLAAGFLFKIAAAPFHMWSPDVYEGSPTSITAFFMITPKAALFAVFLRLFVESFYDFFFSWQILFLLASIASLLIGSFAALSQTKIKRLLAYSSIGHVGYLLAGLACGTIEGVQAVLLYLIIYICMNINLFALFLCSTRKYSYASYSRIKYISDLSYLAKTNPLIALTLTLTLFSMAGIPPLAGFYSKAYLFFATLSSGLYSLAILGVLTSVLSCFYYIRLIKIMYFQVPQNWCSFLQIPAENAYILAGTLFFLVFLMAYPSPLYIATYKISLLLCA